MAWYSYATLVWCLKGTMIFFFKRMTIGLSQQRLVNYIGYACIVTYIAVILTVCWRQLPCYSIYLVHPPVANALWQITFGCWPVQHNYQ